MLEYRDARPAIACVLYDGHCPVCRRWVARIGPLLRRHGFVLDTLQRRNAPLTEVRCEFADGRVLGGAEAILAIACVIPWSRPIAWVGALPGVRRGLHRLYQWFARRRRRVVESHLKVGEGPRVAVPKLGTATCRPSHFQCNPKKPPPRRHRTTTFFEMP